MYGLVYLIRNTINGKLYVGQTTQRLARRWHDHVQAQQRPSAYRSTLRSAIAKHGPAAFTVGRLDTANSRAELDAKECFWIQQLNTVSPAGYNLTPGGGGYKLSPATREKLRIANIGRKPPNQTGFKHSETTKQFLRTIGSGDGNSFYQRSHTQGARDAIRKKLEGKSLPQSTRLKMAAAQRARRLRERSI